MRTDKSKSSCASCLFSRLVHRIEQRKTPSCGCIKLSPLPDKEVAQHLDKPNFHRGWILRHCMYGEDMPEAGVTRSNAVILEFPEQKSCHFYTPRTNDVASPSSNPQA